MVDAAYDRDLNAARHLIECCFDKLRRFRRVATRHEKTARNCASVVSWLR